MRGVLKQLRTLLGRVWRDVQRQSQGLGGKALLEASEELSLARRVLDQKRKGRDKLYSLHEPQCRRADKPL